MKRYFNEVKISEISEGKIPEGKIPEGWRITSTRKSDGEDTLTLTFEPPVVITMATVSSAEMTMPLPMVTLVLMAHGRSNQKDIELPGWSRVGNDVLFEKTITGQQTLKLQTTYADTSRFELVHRPDLFPPEEIVPKWELAPASESPPPSRKPAQPNFKKN